MKTTLDLPDDLVLAVKNRASEHHRRLKDTVEDLLRRALAEEDGAPAATTRRRIKVPLVECRHEARAGQEMTPERVSEVLLQEEAELRL